MNKISYTASGRLGVWDSIDKPGMEKWRSQLDELLQFNAHGVIESDVLNFSETEDPALAAVTAICDKIIARGNPTLVDPNWEGLVLSGPGSKFIRASISKEGKFIYRDSLLPPGSSFDMLGACWELLDLFQNGIEQTQGQSVEDAISSVSAGAPSSDESCIRRAAWQLLLRPLAVQRSLRGLLLLYRNGALDASGPQRILIIEEDMPVVGDAFHMLCLLWELIYTLQPEIGVRSPEVQIDVVGERGLKEPRFGIHYVDIPTGNYDAVISNSLLLGSGHSNPKLERISPDYVAKAIRLRRGVSLSSRNCLQWSTGFHYGLEEDNKRQEEALREILKVVFRKEDFLPGQLKSIVRLLRGEQAVVLLPTGGGKSLIYQFVGMLLPGMTVVVDPIISLIDDQVRSLKSMGIDRMTGISSQTKDTHESFRRMAEGELSYIFIAPERMQSQRFRDGLLDAKSHVSVSLVVLDEAHCLSEWGHDFRPAYLRLPQNLKNYCSDPTTGDFPTLVALTGTASYAVLEDMQAELEIIDEDAIVRPESFDRKELRFDVRVVSPESRAQELAQTRRRLPDYWQLDTEEFRQWRETEKDDCGLVFCPHINGDLGVVEVAKGLGHSDYYAGDSPRKFNGNWNNYKQKKQIQFTKSEIRELVTTKSFGMGIDKENIRSTIHYVMPASIEQFYQEAGRAGRNRVEGYALCTVIYSHSEWGKAQEILRETDHGKAMRELNRVPWDRRGDAFVQLYFLLNSYKGRENEIRGTVEFWQNYLFSETREHRQIVRIPFGYDREKSDREKYIYRLAILGIVEDYTLDWAEREFETALNNSYLRAIRPKLENYLSRYKFQADVNEKLEGLVGNEPGELVEQAVSILVNFVYDEVVAKRKQAILNMGELCSRYKDSDSFRGDILDYLEESPFTKGLNSWRGRSFSDVGLAAVRKMITLQVETSAGDEKGRLRALLGTVRRMLEADPTNVALRYLSVIARSMSTWETDRSVIDESIAMFSALRRESSSQNSDVTNIQIELLHDIFQRRPDLAALVADSIVKGSEGLGPARCLLGLGRKYGDNVRVVALAAVCSNIVERLADISGFYDSDQSGRQENSYGE